MLASQEEPDMDPEELGEDARMAEHTNDGEESKAYALKGLLYGVQDRPPVHVMCLYGLQLTFSACIPPLMYSYIIHKQLCADGNQLVFVELLSTSLFMVGLGTFLQVSFGIRLPAIQGPSACYLLPVIAMTNVWTCSEPCESSIDSSTNSTYFTPNITSQSIETTAQFTPTSNCSDNPEPWKYRIMTISGSLAVASLVHILCGITGIVGALQKCVGPLTIASTITLIAFSLVPVVTNIAKKNWGVSIFTSSVYILYGVVLSKYLLPFPSWSKTKGLHLMRFRIFRLFPTALALLSGWLLCCILTISDAIPNDESHANYYTRTDVKTEVIHSSRWFFFPYPGYWGTPEVKFALVVGFLAAEIGSIVESIGDYYAMAGICQEPTPPAHAMNRGIMMEGMAGILSGLLGACVSTTTHSQYPGIVAITGMASRYTYQTAGLFLIMCGLFGKFGAAFSLVPDPVIGGLQTVEIGMLAWVGISSLKHCDMSAIRNIIVFTTSLILGLMVPLYMKDTPDAIQTGNEKVDEIITLFLKIGMMVGATVAFTLDNLLPGDRKMRGITAYEKDLRAQESGRRSRIYDLPWISKWVRSRPFLRHVPILPGYTGLPSIQCRKSRRVTVTPDPDTCNGDISL